MCSRFLTRFGRGVVWPFVTTLVEALVAPEYVVLLSQWEVGWRPPNQFIGLSATQPLEVSFGVIGDPSLKHQASVIVEYSKL